MISPRAGRLGEQPQADGLFQGQFHLAGRLVAF
jgi:hypothetical protein